MKSQLALLKTFDLMGGSTYGFIRKRDKSKSSSVLNNPFNFPLKLLMFFSFLWLIPGIFIFLSTLSNFTYFFTLPEPAPMIDMNSRHVRLLKDFSFTFSTIAVPRRTKEIKKNTMLIPLYRTSRGVRMQDPKGNTFLIKNPETYIDMATEGDFIAALPFLDAPSPYIMTEADVKKRAIGRNLYAFQQSFRHADTVIQLRDATLAYFDRSISGNLKGFKRQGGLVLVADRGGTVTHFRFSDEQGDIHILDHLPLISRLSHIPFLRSYLRGIHAQAFTDGTSKHLFNRIFDRTVQEPLKKNPLVKGFSEFSFIFLLTAGFLMPLLYIYLVAAAFFLNKKIKNDAIVKRARRVSYFFIPVLIILLIHATDLGTLLPVFLSVIFGYFVFLPSYSKAIKTCRCNFCTSWDELVRTGNYPVSPDELDLPKDFFGRKVSPKKPLLEVEYTCNICGNKRRVIEKI